MTIWRLLTISAAALATSTIGSQAGPCDEEIYRMEARFEALLQAKAAAGPTAPQSTEARLHHQPTRESIAATISRLGIASPQAAEAVARGMALAREADRAGDLHGCLRALADVQTVIER
jgi:hypothetical protein